MYKHYVNPHVVLTNNCVFYTVLFEWFQSGETFIELVL